MTPLWLFLCEKWFKCQLQKVIRKETLKKKINYLVAILNVTAEKIAGSGAGSVSPGTDPRIRIAGYLGNAGGILIDDLGDAAREGVGRLVTTENSRIRIRIRHTGMHGTYVPRQRGRHSCWQSWRRRPGRCRATCPWRRDPRGCTGWSPAFPRTATPCTRTRKHYWAY